MRLAIKLLLLLLGQITVTESSDFPKQLQLRALTATVRVQNPLRKTEGSGVIVGKTGNLLYILTAQHIVKDGETVEIALYSEKTYPKIDQLYRNGRVVAQTADLRDLALVRVPTEEMSPGVLQLCPLADIPKTDGFSSLAVGCALGQAPTTQIGTVQKRKVRQSAKGDSAYFWEWPTEMTRGRSGGPLLDKRGYVIGICSGNSNGKGYFTHAEEIHGFLKKNAFRWLAEEDK